MLVNERWELQSQRKAFGKVLVELGERRPDIVVASADLSCSVQTMHFAKRFPERHFNFGIAEQNMVSASAGLATTGKTVFASTFAIFGTGRVYDQVRQSVCYPKLNVKLGATHAGITVGPDGATHQMIEDMALMRALPNMTVLVPADAPETERAVRAAAEFEGPVYIRLGRANVPVCTNTGECADFRIGKATVMRPGTDITLVGTGIMVAKCLEAAEALESEGIDARVINVHTLKPLDTELLARAASETSGIVTAEEHSLVGGLGEAVATVLGEREPVPMRRIGIPDRFGESGPPDELMEKYGLTVKKVIAAAREVVADKG
jgi:transketolase